MAKVLYRAEINIGEGYYNIIRLSEHPNARTNGGGGCRDDKYFQMYRLHNGRRVISTRTFSLGWKDLTLKRDLRDDEWYYDITDYIADAEMFTRVIARIRSLYDDADFEVVGLSIEDVMQELILACVTTGDVEGDLIGENSHL